MKGGKPFAPLSITTVLVQFRLKGVARTESTYELVLRQSVNRMEQGYLDSF
jgi:hypothetical protein